MLLVEEEIVHVAHLRFLRGLLRGVTYEVTKSARVLGEQVAAVHICQSVLVYWWRESRGMPKAWEMVGYWLYVSMDGKNFHKDG